jgi:hypothetical protein
MDSLAARTAPRSLLLRATAALVATLLLALASATGAGAAVGDADLPQVAVDPTDAGDVSFVWKRNDGSTAFCCDVIQGRKRSAAGALGGVFNLSAGGQHADMPKVAVAPDGTAVFVWARNDGSNPDTNCCTIIQGRVRTPGGTLGGVFNLSAPGASASFPEVAIGPDGKVVFAWVREQIVQGRVRTVAGPSGTLGAVFDVSSTTAGHSAGAPQLAVGGDGAATFMFSAAQGGATRFRARRRSAANVLGAIFDVSADTSFPDSNDVAAAPDGKTTFVWKQQPGSSGLIQGRARNADGTMGAIFDIATSGSNAHPKVAVAPNDGKATFTWMLAGLGFSGTDSVIKGRGRAAGGTLGGPFDVSDTTSGFAAQAPQVVAAPDGRVTFAWHRSDGAGNVLIQGRSRSSGGAMGAIFDLSAAGNHSDVQLGVAADGRVSFAWRRNIPSPGSGSFIQGRSRSAGGGLGSIFNLSQHPLVP